jgi:UDP-N-acetylmuramoylalanine--D-glutamate ligase
MSGFTGLQVLVIGLGASGLAAARVLVEEGARVRISERRSAAELEQDERRDELRALDAEVLTGGHDEAHLDGAALVVTSPGVPEEAPILQAAHRRGIPVWSELELGARLCTVPYVAVTGTNGKSTTTEMVASCMRADGLDAMACGNIGHPFSLAAREGHQALAVEASSFQLRFHHTFHPKVSVLLNVAPDHLDWHGSLERYRAAKARVFERQGSGDTHVGNRDDAAGAKVSQGAPCALVWFRFGAPGAEEVGFEDGVLVSRIHGKREELGRPTEGGAGFRADAAAAAAASIAFGVSAPSAREGIAGVRPLEHRGQVVAIARSVRFVDDSKATNPHAALAALEGLEDVVLIAGGLSKGVDLSPLASATPALAGVIAMGEAGPQIAALFEGAVPVRRVSSIEQAVEAAAALVPPGGTVLLAPACASQDMFRDYRERGDRFAEAARRIADGRTRASVTRGPNGGSRG